MVEISLANNTHWTPFSLDSACSSVTVGIYGEVPAPGFDI